MKPEKASQFCTRTYLVLMPYLRVQTLHFRALQPRATCNSGRCSNAGE